MPLDTDQASNLASILFTHCVLADEDALSLQYGSKYGDHDSFDRNALEQKVFLYLVANIAIALSNEAAVNKDDVADYVFSIIHHLRCLVRNEMLERWGIDHQKSDDLIDSAANDYASLLFTDPSKNKGISFDWAQGWLRQVGIDECNPASLFKFSHKWRTNHLYMARFLSEQIGNES